MSNDNNPELNTLVESLSKEVDSLEGLSAAVAKLQKLAIERMLKAEMDDHLGYEKHAPDGYDGGNSRNGTGSKTVLLDSGAVELEVPRDRDGSFEPKVVKKRQRRLKGFDDKLISLYARGLTAAKSKVM